MSRYMRGAEEVFTFTAEQWRQVIDALHAEENPETRSLGDKLGLALATWHNTAGDFCSLDRLESHYIRMAAERIGLLPRGERC